MLGSDVLTQSRFAWTYGTRWVQIVLACWTGTFFQYVKFLQQYDHKREALWPQGCDNSTSRFICTRIYRNMLGIFLICAVARHLIDLARLPCDSPQINTDDLAAINLFLRVQWRQTTKVIRHVKDTQKLETPRMSIDPRIFAAQTANDIRILAH